jgi:hypothetical protein
MTSLPPNPPPNRDTWSDDGYLGFLIALVIIALMLVFSGCPAPEERPPFPCDINCAPAKCRPWCGTPPAFPVREPAPTPPAAHL